MMNGIIASLAAFSIAARILVVAPTFALVGVLHSAREGNPLASSTSVVGFLVLTSAVFAVMLFAVVRTKDNSLRIPLLVTCVILTSLDATNDMSLLFFPHSATTAAITRPIEELYELVFRLF